MFGHVCKHCSNGLQLGSFEHADCAVIAQFPASALRTHCEHCPLATLPVQSELLHACLQSPGVVHAHVSSLASTVAAASGNAIAQHTRHPLPASLHGPVVDASGTVPVSPPPVSFVPVSGVGLTSLVVASSPPSVVVVSPLLHAPTKIAHADAEAKEKRTNRRVFIGASSHSINDAHNWARCPAPEASARDATRAMRVGCEPRFFAFARRWSDVGRRQTRATRGRMRRSTSPWTHSSMEART